LIGFGQNQSLASTVTFDLLRLCLSTNCNLGKCCPICACKKYGCSSME